MSDSFRHRSYPVLFWKSYYGFSGRPPGRPGDPRRL